MSVRIAKPALLDELRSTHEVVEASAGTGKTFTLQRLVADLVLRGTPLERILVVTFTEKATQELRTRIRTYLQELLDATEEPDGVGGLCSPTPWGSKGEHRERSEQAVPPFWEVDGEGRERLGAALRGFEGASISTIHGFCRQVLQEATLEGRTLFDRELVDERALFGRAFREALTRVFTQDPGQRDLLEAALAEGTTTERLEADLWAVHTDGGELRPRLETWREWVTDLDPAWLKGAEALASAWKAARLNGNRINAARRGLEGLAEAWRASASDHALCLALESLNLASLWAATAELAALPGPHGPLQAWLARGEEALPSPRALRIHHFLPEVRETQRRLALAEGLFTFQSMVHGVVEALDGPDGEALAGRLRDRYDIALVDEFQDTDPLQWQVFRRIFLREDRRLVIIGDPKQAIYGFRGGDLPTYQAACREILGGAQPQRLERNFRSTDRVLEATNHILSGAGPASFFRDPTLYPRPVVCGRPGLRATVKGGPLRPVDVLVLDSAAGGQRLWRRLARQVALRIQRLVASGISFGEPGQERRLGYGDVQVLVGKGTEGELMAQALRSEGIPCAFARQKGLFQTREAEEWLDALRAVADPRNRSLQLRAFLSAFFGYDLEDLRGLAALPEEHAALQRLLAWGALAQQHRYGEMLDAMLEESGLSRRLLLAETGHRRLVNFRHLAESLLGVAALGRVSLEDLIRKLDRWRRGIEGPSAEEGDLQRLEGDRNAVQLLTLHAAKGLEAPIVALFAFGRGRGSDLLRFHQDGRRCLCLGSPSARIKALADAEKAAEQERLLYVALTRAQAKLVLCAFEQRTAKGELTRLGCAYDALNRRLVEMRDEREDLFAWERLEALGDTALEREVPALPADTVLPALPAGPLIDYAHLARGARPFVTTSFTALQHRMEASEAPARGDVDPPGLRPPQGDLPGGSRTGQALHELLEWADVGTLGTLGTLGSLETWRQRPEVRTRVREALDLHGLPRHWETKVTEIVHSALTSELPLAWGGTLRVADSERLLREVDFCARFLESDRFPDERDLLKGSIDVLCERGGRAYLLDWKSNLLPDYEPGTLHATVSRHYLLQAQVYLQACLAILDIRDGAAYEARFGGILYVFLRGLPSRGTWSLRPSWNEVRAWTRELERIHGEVILG
jgi:exodeoxyribonuclease V beta subunit